MKEPREPAPLATVAPIMDRVTGLQLFIRVVETGSFSKAAEELHVAQPTATKHVAALEQRLGVRLLHRSTRGVTATEVGALYYDKCKSIVAQLDEADSLAALQQGSAGGTLRVTTSVGFGRRVLMPLVLRYMREQPKLAIDLSFDDRYVNLVEQGIDVAIRMGRLADSTLGARYLGVNPWLMVAAPSYLAARGTPREPPTWPRTTASSTAACRATSAGTSPRPAAKRAVGAGERTAALEQPVGGARRLPRRLRHRDPAVVRRPRCGR